MLDALEVNWPFLFVLFLFFMAGCVGGFINAFLTVERDEKEGGFVLPRVRKFSNSNRTVVLPGFLGNILVGGFTAVVLPLLFGSLATTSIVGGANADIDVRGFQLAAAMLGGAGGSNLLANLTGRLAEKAAKEDLLDVRALAEELED